MLQKSRVSNRSRCSRHMFRSRPGVRGLFNRHVSRPALSLSTLHHRHVIQKKSQSQHVWSSEMSHSTLWLLLFALQYCAHVTPEFITITIMNSYLLKHKYRQIHVPVLSFPHICRLREISEIKSSCCCQWKFIVSRFYNRECVFFVQFRAINHQIEKSAI